MLNKRYFKWQAWAARPNAMFIFYLMLFTQESHFKILLNLFENQFDLQLEFIVEKNLFRYL